MKQQSEYGKGFIYNLILFSKHYWRWQEFKELDKISPSFLHAEKMWFNGAADHLFDLEIPPQFENKPWAKRLEKLKSKAIYWRLHDCTEAEFNSFWEDFEDIMRSIDRELGIKPIKADWN